MAATTLIRPGSNNLGADTTENFLVKGSQMVITEYQNRRIMEGKVRQVEAPAGAAAVQMPVTGSIGGGFHTPGDHILLGTNAGGTKDYLQNMRSGVITIAPDKRMLAGPVQVDELDMSLNYWSANAVHLREMGIFLADLQDQKELALVSKGATQAADRAYTGEPGGNEVIVSGTHTDRTTITGAQLVQAVFDMGDKFFGKNVPEDQRCLALPVELYSLFLKEASSANLVVDVDFQGGEANASVARGYIKMVNGFQIVRTNHLPAVAINDNDADGLALDNLEEAGGGSFGDHRLQGASGAKVNVYNMDSRNLVGLAWQADAIGTATFQAPRFESKYDMNYQGTAMVGSVVTGSQVLRPSNCGIIRWASV